MNDKAQPALDQFRPDGCERSGADRVPFSNSNASAVCDDFDCVGDNFKFATGAFVPAPLDALLSGEDGCQFFSGIARRSLRAVFEVRGAQDSSLDIGSRSPF